jgi:replicative superfamily II helicase
MPLVNSITGLEQLNFDIIKSDYAPVVKSFHAVKNLNKTIFEHIKGNKKTNLVYFSSPTYLEKFYLKNLKDLKIRIELSDQWINRVEEDFHPDWLPIRALNSGIGIHYGPMPKFIQKKVIELFKNKLIHNILATSSIIEGVNTPTKSIFIANSKDILGKENLVKFKNLIGRAGRLGEHKVGEIYYKESDKIKFENANVPYQEINIQFVINKRAEILEINREVDFYEVQDSENEKTIQQNETLKSILDDSNYKNVSHIEVSKLLNTHGFTLNQLRILIEYLKKDKIYLIGIIGKVYKSSIDSNAYNIALNHKYKSFKEMIDELCNQKPNENISKNISSLIEMIYSVLPFKILPLLNFTLDLNDLYNKHNEKALVNERLISEAIQKKAQFYSKFIGVDNPTHESLVIVNKLFEYGIPYHRVKPFIKEIEEKLPNNFSIHDIRKIIFETESMNDLKIYFE